MTPYESDLISQANKLIAEGEANLAESKRLLECVQVTSTKTQLECVKEVLAESPKQHTAVTPLTLREWRFRRPFKPFALRLKNGDAVPVWHDGGIAWGGPKATQCMVYVGEQMKFIDIASIVDINEIVTDDL